MLKIERFKMIKVLKVYHVKKGQQLNARIIHNGEKFTVTVNEKMNSILSCNGYSLHFQSIDYLNQSVGFYLLNNNEKINFNIKKEA